jgi:hypothetical protein
MDRLLGCSFFRCLLFTLFFQMNNRAAGPQDIGDAKAIMNELRGGVERLLHAVETGQGWF